jgi:hypothetical protein
LLSYIRMISGDVAYVLAFVMVEIHTIDSSSHGDLELLLLVLAHIVVQLPGISLFLLRQSHKWTHWSFVLGMSKVNDWQYGYRLQSSICWNAPRGLTYMMRLLCNWSCSERVCLITAICSCRRRCRWLAHVGYALLFTFHFFKPSLSAVVRCVSQRQKTPQRTPYCSTGFS